MHANLLPEPIGVFYVSDRQASSGRHLYLRRVGGRLGGGAASVSAAA